MKSPISRLLKRKTNQWQSNADVSERQAMLQRTSLEKSLRRNLQEIRQITGNSTDVLVRKFKIAGFADAALVYIDGLINEQVLEELLHSLMVEGQHQPSTTPQAILENLVIIEDVEQVENIADFFDSISTGRTGLLVDGYQVGLMCETKGLEHRMVSEPTAEVSIRGPRDGFIENIRVNTSLLRQRIRIPHLWVEGFEAGTLTKTKIDIAYIKGLANDGLVKEVRNRIKRIEIDGVLESGYVEEFIGDQPMSLFPLVRRTERPDIATADLLEGRVIVLVNNTPHVLIVPAELPMMLQAPDDYYEKFPIGSLIRILRIIALTISLLLPSMYVAVVNFHQELLPTTLIMRISAAREGLPFPIIAEVLLMEFLFELLREAGVRLPQAFGPAISIVGALILGDAAIRAGIVSPFVVIVIALTAIAGFANPVFSLGLAMRVLRFVFTILAAIFGLFGIQFGLLLLLVHLCSLRSYGVPYLTPIAPFIYDDMKDNVIRMVWSGQKKRPTLIGKNEPKRQDKKRKRPTGRT